MPWYFDPHSGGKKIALSSHALFTERVRAFERSRPWFPKIQLSLRFKGQFCYLDMTDTGESEPSPLARLRYFSDERWSMAFYTWSHMWYEACVFINGKWEGTIEEAITTCEPFIVGF
jgi:hypothetical protein